MGLGYIYLDLLQRLYWVAVHKSDESYWFWSLWPENCAKDITHSIASEQSNWDSNYENFSIDQAEGLLEVTRFYNKHPQKEKNKKKNKEKKKRKEEKKKKKKKNITPKASWLFPLSVIW